MRDSRQDSHLRDALRKLYALAILDCVLWGAALAPKRKRRPKGRRCRQIDWGDYAALMFTAAVRPRSVANS